MLKKEGYKVRTASTKSNKALRLTEMLGLIFRYKNQTDIVLIDTYGALNFYYAYLVGKACQLLGMPYIPILHGGNLPERLEHSPKLSASLFGNSVKNVAPSKFLYAVFQEHGFANTQIIPNAIKLDNYPYQQRKTFQPKLLWVRRFQQRYNPLMALKVLKEISKQHPEASLCMVGPEKDGTMKSCKEYAIDHQLNVRFTGKLKKKEWASLARNYDFFVNTTSVDNTPISVIEAMSLGLVIISTEVGGMSRLIENNKDGILVPEENVENMAKVILELIEDQTKARQLAASARNKVEGFSWEEIKPLWENLLEG